MFDNLHALRNSVVPFERKKTAPRRAEGGTGLDIEGFLAHQGRLFDERRLDELAATFATPLPVYMPEAVDMEASRLDTLAALQRLRAAADAHGVTHTECTLLTGATAPEKGSAKVRVTWTYRGTDGAALGTSELDYVCEIGADGKPVVVLIEYLAAAFPETVFKRNTIDLRSRKRL